MTKIKYLALKLSKLTSIDYHIGITLLLRLWTIVAGGILILLVPIFFTENEQGYYFTFASLISLQVFFELGFNYVIVQMVGHEMAYIKINKYKQLEGQPSSISRVYSLIALLKKWYLVISLLFLIIVFISGFYFFKINGPLDIYIWLPAWSILVVFSSVNLFVSPQLAVLEGMGFVGQVAMIRLYQSLIGYILFFILISSGGGLLAVSIISGSSAFISLMFITVKYKNILYRKNHIYSDRISWRKEIFPFQWKIALSWMSGYFIFQLFNPILFVHQGAIEAGRVGLTLQIFSTMLALSMSWITAKSPVMARLIAENNRVELNKLFFSLIIKSGILNIIMSFLFLLFIYVFRLYDFNIVTRVADISVILVLCFTSIINHLVFSMAIYMRAHKEEPMLWNSITVGIIIIPLIYLFSKISSFLTIFSYFMVMVVVCLPWCYVIFKKYYNRKL
ncbi:polysaccharide biosynthesis protein [Yersinia pseudotuberculosis]|uniref:hypothetical protein n=1 Tax=Yersinia pseudotuberculosis TaxID=633 RepID=UPI001A9F893B|nr:hypothetical protein [Yersinia pseudotuberculosis]MBO1550552.1 hypothetical protein [Yersinia pseudotuberculosis]MBO1570568.1 hypothetical protein [Yersinia pseudotuberculosis]MBO1585675.1 hypothetical protein [Yersinia pseudotuberculosis]MBO1634998.1 hypothetical protein [Yersinia pseudotuberculosis]